MSIITDQIAKNVFDGIININETRRNIDASIDENRSIILTPLMTKKSIEEFNFNVGKVSDGKVIRLDENEIYFKVTVNISILDVNNENGSFVYRAYDRANSKQSSLTAYVNGLKIPDNEVLFYPTKSYTDVFVPLKYINQNENETNKILIERKNYKQSTYIRYYRKCTSEQYITIDVDSNKLSKSIVNRHTCMIFIDKVLYTGTRIVDKSEHNNTIEIGITGRELSNNELEIIIDSGIMFYIEPSEENEQSNKWVFEVPESYFDPLHGPISKFSCYFFINGKRILNSEITQEGRFHFSYTDTFLSIPTLAMHVTDIGYITDTDMIFYGSDYYLYNMIGTTAISKALKDRPSNTIFDGHIDFRSILSEEGALYNRERISSLVKLYYSLVSPEDKVNYLLPSRPYLVRTFLENFGKKNYTYTVDYNGTDSFIYIGLPDIYEVYSKRNYDININTLHIQSTDIEIISKDITDIFKISSKLFRTGINIVEINVIDENPIEYVQIKDDDIHTENGAYISRIPVFKRFVSIDDIYVLEKSVNNPSLNYTTNEKIGYTHFKDAHIEYDSDNNEIVIHYDRVPYNDILIYNSNFTSFYRYRKPILSSALDVIIPLFTGTTLNVIPYIPKGKIDVYVGNDKLIQGIDYFIKHPVNEDKTAGSFIIIKRAILPGSVFDVYFSNIRTHKVMEKAGYFKNNKYGLFYLGELNYPFSLKYLDVHINNKRCTEADIDILSDKLIRIHSLPVPMFDLLIESTFTVENEYLKPYIDFYEEDEFEQYIASLFKSVYYNRPYDPNEIIDENAHNTIYENEFINTVDSVNKRPNPLARESEWIPSDTTDPNIKGIYNNGNAMGGKDIYTSLIAGNMYIVAGEEGRVAACNITTGVWSNYDSEDKYTYSGFHIQGDIRSSVFYKGIIIFATDRTEILYYDMINDKWHFPNDPSTNRNLNKLPYEYFPGGIYKMEIIGDNLIIMGEHGNVTTHSFQKNIWYAYNDRDYSRKDYLTASGVMDDIYDSYVYTYYSRGEYITALIVVGKNGEIASGNFKTNYWSKPDGLNVPEAFNGPGIYSDGSSRTYSDIYVVTRYLDYLVLYGENGLVTLYDLIKKISLVGDNKNISNSGTHNGYRNVNAALTYNDVVLVSGANEGAISSYYGENEHWNIYNGGNTLTNYGDVMEFKSIFTIAFTFVDTNYIIFAGKDGKVATYNVDAHELAFRFNPYKTAFLTWYTTPGNAFIDTAWELPDNVISLFSMYKESEDTNYDIQVAGGDIDIIADIDMDDRGRYPHSYAERRQYIVDFILELDEGRYTADEVWELYLNSHHKHILYPWDVVPLAAGDYLERNEDINITGEHVPNNSDNLTLQRYVNMFDDYIYGEATLQ